MTFLSISSRAKSWAVASSLLGGLLLSSSGHAGDEFTPHYQKARECYEAKNYPCAIDELSAAYQAKPLPGILLNIGHAHLDAGQPAEALTYYDRYLLQERNLTPALSAEVEGYRQQAKAKLAAMPKATTAPVAPVAAPVTPAAPTADAGPKPAVSRPPTGALALLGAGAAVLLVGVGLSGAAVSTAKDVVATDGAFDTALDQKGMTLGRAGTAMDILGAATLVAGTGWMFYWVANRKKEAAPPTAVSVRPLGLGVLVSGGF